MLGIIRRAQSAPGTYQGWTINPTSFGSLDDAQGRREDEW